MYINFGSPNGKRDIFGNVAVVNGSLHRVHKFWPIKIWVGYQYYFLKDEETNELVRNDDGTIYGNKEITYIETKWFWS